MRPNEGIDLIRLVLNPLFLNVKSIRKHIDPYNYLTIRRNGCFWVLSITAEYFNQCFDYQSQICMAIYYLVQKGIIDFIDTPMTPYFIYKHHEYFILNLCGIEFYTDFRVEDIHIDECMYSTSLAYAKENRTLYRYFNKETGSFTDTYYSFDYTPGRRHSWFIIYNKEKKDLRDNQIKKEDILSNPYKIRCEFRIYENNSCWLNWSNLEGSYFDIFNRYKRYLAVIYNNYVIGCVNVKGRYNFMEIIHLALKEGKVRYRGKKLKKQDMHTADIQFPERHLSVEDIENRKGNIAMKFDDFSKKRKNVEKAAEIAERIEESQVKVDY